METYQEHNFGKKLAEYESSKGKITALKAGAVAALLLLGGGGAFVLLANPVGGDENALVGMFLLVAGLIIGMCLWFISGRLYSKATIFEEGVAVIDGKKEHNIHYNEIVGLRDIIKDESTTITHRGGIAGAVAAGIIAGAASAAAAEKRRNKARNITIIAEPDEGARRPRGINVIDTGGDKLCKVYTKWLITKNAITKENLKTLSLSFGDKLKFENGAFIQVKRKDDIVLTLEDIIKITIEYDSVFFYALNHKGKEAVLISVDVKHVLNLNLLFHIHKLHKEGTTQTDAENMHKEDSNDV